MLPITFTFAYAAFSDELIPYIMQEFAENGAENLVLSSYLISRILQKPGLLFELEKALQANGLRFVDAHNPFGLYLDLNVPQPALRGIMLERHKLALRIAAHFGVKTTAVHVGNLNMQIFPEYGLEQVHAAALRSLEELLPLAEELDVCLALENIWCPTNTPERLQDLMARCPSSHLGLCYDSGHANLMTKDQKLENCGVIQQWQGIEPIAYDKNILKKMLPEIVNCHLHDNDGISDLHKLPGQGSVDWQEVKTLLAQAPRLQCIQAEVRTVPDRLSIARLCRQFKEFFQK